MMEIQRKWIRRMHLRVYPDGRVVVTVPMLMPTWVINDFVNEHSEWIARTQERLRNNPPRPLPTVTKEQAQELKEWLTERVAYWRQIMNEEPVTWKIRNMKTQWGNCRAASRRLTFNLQLALVDNDLRDYIVVHELSHLQVQNHGPLFKARVARFLPDWEQRRKRLRQAVACH